MFSKKLQDAINEQINKELYSAYLYLGMSAYFEANNLPGMAKWMRVQFGEEQEHALKFYDFIVDRGGSVELKAIDQPEAELKSPLVVWETTLEHEKKVTGLIHKLYEVALAEKDYAAQVMLQWFISEQVEEEKNATQIVGTLKMTGEKGQALVMLDHQLGRRGGD